MTLIEIVAGLVILGTILASLSIARGRFARQWAEADRKIAAARALDSLIAEWMRTAVPLNRQGELSDTRNFIWRTRTSKNPGRSRLGAAVVRVEVFERGNEEKFSAPAIVSVDLLVHVPLKTAATLPSATAGPE